MTISHKETWIIKIKVYLLYSDTTQRIIMYNACHLPEEPSSSLVRLLNDLPCRLVGPAHVVTSGRSATSFSHSRHESQTRGLSWRSMYVSVVIELMSDSVVNWLLNKYSVSRAVQLANAAELREVI